MSEGGRLGGFLPFPVPCGAPLSLLIRSHRRCSFSLRYSRLLNEISPAAKYPSSGPRRRLSSLPPGGPAMTSRFGGHLFTYLVGVGGEILGRVRSQLILLSSSFRLTELFPLGLSSTVQSLDPV